jgi:hypothetical protein
VVTIGGRTVSVTTLNSPARRQPVTTLDPIRNSGDLGSPWHKLPDVYVAAVSIDEATI